MALHLSREAAEAAEILQFKLRDTGELVKVEAQYVKWMALLVKFGERNAITTKQALKAMGVTDTDSHRRQWRAAADYWQEQGVFVGSTSKGYFIPNSDSEKQKCVNHKAKEAASLTRRMNRMVNLPIGQGFP